MEHFDEMFLHCFAEKSLTRDGWNAKIHSLVTCPVEMLHFFFFFFFFTFGEFTFFDQQN